MKLIEKDIVCKYNEKLSEGGTRFCGVNLIPRKDVVKCVVETLYGEKFTLKFKDLNDLVHFVEEINKCLKLYQRLQPHTVWTHNQEIYRFKSGQAH